MATLQCLETPQLKCKSETKFNSLRKVLPSTLVLPVSGHGMVEQIGILLWLSQRGYKPKVTFGASGGAIAAALGIAFQWNAAKWMEWMQTLGNVEVFKSRPLGYMEGAFRMSFYELGPGLQVLFNCISQIKVEEYFRSQELLISAQNLNGGYMEIFSTVSQNKSVLRNAKGPLRLFGVNCQITFLGNITDSTQYRDKLIKVLKATSAVPIVFPPVEIDGNLYVDGGVSYSSPLNPLMSLYTADEIVYIFPEDIEQPNPHFPKNAIDNGMAFLSQCSRSKYYQDRNGYLQGMCGGDFSKLMIMKGDASNIEEALSTTRGKKRMVELMPCISRSLPIMSKHTKKEMMARIAENVESFRYRIFYL